MKRIAWAAALALVAGPALAHDMFLVVPDHDLPSESAVTVWLYNGSFAASENAIDRERMADVTVVDGAGAVTHPAPEQWREEGAATLLEFRTGAPGTYVVGVSTKPRAIELSAAEFNDYLEHDGVLDVLAARRQTGTLDQAAGERYAKHVKTILRVGERGSPTWAHRLGYAVEIVPRSDPSRACPGSTLEFEVLASGAPAAGQLVYASYDGFEPEPEGGEREAVATRTDAAGVARIEISREGRWYLRLIRMVEVDEPGVDYESNWATLTFEATCPEGE